jgi:hypothetical protein
VEMMTILTIEGCRADENQLIFVHFNFFLCFRMGIIILYFITLFNKLYHRSKTDHMMHEQCGQQDQQGPGQECGGGGQ